MAFIGNGAQLTDLDAGDIASGTLPVARGGTGTASPSLVPGTGISITGSFPNQTVTSTVTGGVTSFNGNTGALAGYELITSGTVSSGATSINIGSLPSGYKTFKFLFNLPLSTTSSTFDPGIRVSTNGGSSYISTASYVYHKGEFYSGGANDSSTDVAQNQILMPRVVYATAGGTNYYSLMFDVIQSTNGSYCGILGQSSVSNTNGAGILGVFGGQFISSTYVNGIQIFRTSGSITFSNGGYIVYGAK